MTEPVRYYVARCNCGKAVAVGMVDQDYGADKEQMKILANRGYTVHILPVSSAPEPLMLEPCTDRQNCIAQKHFNTKPGFLTI